MYISMYVVPNEVYVFTYINAIYTDIPIYMYKFPRETDCDL